MTIFDWFSQYYQIFFWVTLGIMVLSFFFSIFVEDCIVAILSSFWFEFWGISFIITLIASKNFSLWGIGLVILNAIFAIIHSFLYLSEDVEPEILGYGPFYIVFTLLKIVIERTFNPIKEKKEVKNRFSDIKNNKSLNLANMKIRKISQLPYFKHFDAYKKIKTRNFRNKEWEFLKSIEELNLSGNRIKKIERLETLEKMRVLDLSWNRIKKTKITGLLDSLEEVNLSGNRIKNIEYIYALSQLKKIDLSKNQIAKIKGINNLTQLRELNLSGNRITEINGINNLTQLRELNLSGNKITEIKGLEKLTQLKELDLSMNKITEIKGLENLTQLRKLKIDGLNLINIQGLAFLAKLEHIECNGFYNFPDLQDKFYDNEIDLDVEGIGQQGIALIIEYCIDTYKEIDPINPDVWYRLGITYKKLKNFQKAEHYYNIALKHDPNHIPSLNDLGVFCHYRKNFPEAIRYYKEVLEIDSNNAKAKNRLGNVYRDPNYVKVKEKIEKTRLQNVNRFEDNISKNRKKEFMEIEIKREFEFYQGQIRFKIGFINNLETVITDLNVRFIIPEALKWINHEPDFKRSEDYIKIPKLNPKEKKVINLYLEPINCMEGDIRAIITYLDAHNQLRTTIMQDKTINITCPIFFTPENANLARVKNIYGNLTNKDRKRLTLPSGDLPEIFSLIQSAISIHDIKLISKESPQEGKIGKLMYYGLTKVNQNSMVIKAILDGKQKLIELEVAGDNEDSITSLIAEITNRLMTSFKENGLFQNRIETCQHCGKDINLEDQIKYEKGQHIFCEYCKNIILNYRN